MTIEEKKEYIGSLLMNVRLNNDISQNSVIKQSGLHHTQIKGIENGCGNYSINVLLAYIPCIGKIPFSVLKCINKTITV